MEIWESRLLDRAKTLGFASLEEYLKARPGVPYTELADELAGETLGVQISDLQLRRAFKSGGDSFRDAARDALVRCLRQTLTEGWGRTQSEGVEPDFVNITAGTTWASLIKRVSPNDKRTEYVWEALDARATDGWLPKNVDDPTLKAAFDEGWAR